MLENLVWVENATVKTLVIAAISPEFYAEATNIRQTRNWSVVTFREINSRTNFALMDYDYYVEMATTMIRIFGDQFWITKPVLIPGNEGNLLLFHTWEFFLQAVWESGRSSLRVGSSPTLVKAGA